MLVGSSIVTTMLIPPEAFQRGRRSVRPRAGVSRTRAPRPHLRHRLRPQHGRDPVVRRRVGDGRAAQPRAAVPAALRDGARVGQGQPPARADLHRDHLRRDDPVRGGRQRAGRRLRHRRARADGVGGARRDDRGVAGRHALVRLPPADAHLRLHDARQHHRAARRPEDRHHLHHRHRHQLDGVARAALDRAARAMPSKPTTWRAQFLDDAVGGPVRIIANRPGHRAAGRVRAQAERGDGVAPPDAGRRSALHRGPARRRLGVQRCAAGTRAQPWIATACCAA